MTKKIMFKDKYCLTQAVLSGTKTMTRRVLTLTLDKKVAGKLTRVYPSKVFFDNGKWLFDLDGKTYLLPKENYPRYNVGEVVAVIQPYKDIVDYMAEYNDIMLKRKNVPFREFAAGWSDKRFVKAAFMPHHIRITDIKVERLQDISDEDIMREGVWQFYDNELFYVSQNIGYAPTVAFPSARLAFWYLIDKISGKGTWERNPWVAAYSFELVD